jgi:hypothetical protein
VVRRGSCFLAFTFGLRTAPSETKRRAERYGSSAPPLFRTRREREQEPSQARPTIVLRFKFGAPPSKTKTGLIPWKSSLLIRLKKPRTWALTRTRPSLSRMVAWNCSIGDQSKTCRCSAPRVLARRRVELTWTDLVQPDRAVDGHPFPFERFQPVYHANKKSRISRES